jgi:uncharacterized RDD family membrane protein YckC
VSGVPVNSLQPAGIVTPEAVLLEFETAGAGSRAAAEVLDVALQAVVLVLAALAVAAVDSSSGRTGAVVISLGLFLLVLVGYPVAAESLWNGRTLGKAALGLRVVTVEGGPIRFRHAAIRGIIGLFEIYLTLGLVALLAIIFGRRDQRLGDHVAGTIILRERTAPGRQAVAVNFPAPWGLEAYVASLDVSALTSEQYGIIRSFLLRVLELSHDARWSLAVKLANATALELHLTPPPGVGPEPFLACVAASYQRRHGPAGPVASFPPPPMGAPAGPTPIPNPAWAPPPIPNPAWAPPPIPNPAWAPPPATSVPTTPTPTPGPAPTWGPPAGPPPTPPTPGPTAPVSPPAAFPWDRPADPPAAPPGWDPPAGGGGSGRR